MTNLQLTYNEWNSRGYYINKGAKAATFVNGVALFNRCDVHKKLCYHDNDRLQTSTSLEVDDIGNTIVMKDGKYLNHTTGNYQNRPVSIFDVLAGM